MVPFGYYVPVSTNTNGQTTYTVVSKYSLMEGKNQTFLIFLSPTEPSPGPAADNSFVFRCKNHSQEWQINKNKGRRNGLLCLTVVAFLLVSGWLAVKS